jgi:hypothetical protein
VIESWRDVFDRDPEQAVADLFSGRAGLGADLRLDAPELLYQEFPDRPNQAADRERLDQALLTWLQTMRRDYAAQVRRLGYAGYGKRLCDALVAAQLLDLPRVNHQVRETLDAWLRWLVPLRIAPERDPALECWRLLTQRQPDAAHTAAWLRLAADPRPEYLGVALAGLEGLPNDGDARSNQVLMAHGLLRHALAAYATAAEQRAFFNRRFAALRGPYPRGPAHWRQVLADALRGFSRNARNPAVGELARLLKEEEGGRRRTQRRGAAVFEPASQQAREALSRDIEGARGAPEVLAQRFFAIQVQNQRCAETTGDSYYFVRTLSNLGGRLLARELPADAMQRFGTMVEQALAWEPMNPYCWMLWADWMGHRGRYDQREWVLRERVRMKPENEPARVELARLLIRRGEAHWDEAERWLREAAERNPDNEPSRVVLASLLVRRNRSSEGVDLLNSLLERNPRNSIARALLERLRPEAVESWEDLDGLSSPEFSDAEGWGVNVPGEVIGGSDQGSAMDSGGTGPGGSVAQAPNAGPWEIRGLAEVVRRGRLAAELSRARLTAGSNRGAQTPMIQAEAHSGDALAGLYLQWLDPDNRLEAPPHAWAWRACRLWQTRAPADDWARLEQEFPERRRETQFLRLLLPLGAAEWEQESRRWRRRYGVGDEDEALPAMAFMRKRLGGIPAGSLAEQQQTALSVLDSAAVDTPEFSA